MMTKGGTAQAFFTPHLASVYTRKTVHDNGRPFVCVVWTDATRLGWVVKRFLGDCENSRRQCEPQNRILTNRRDQSSIVSSLALKW
ncbi:hypothetical protein FHS27_006362 [Rhodopirellula rubra]|uniref:Uncharacterized protein n=1 Tax=Aporhodopirellula rubra TaxID=980271 RepID=A0A7W5E5D3_9BACT|nr:hypothetical protein [Aporhodopirellula rubra]